MDYTPLQELQAGQRGYKIVGRVIKIWDSTNPSMHDELISLDFLLVDDQRTAIQGSIRKEDASQLKELINEGEIYMFAKFIVTPVNKDFRVCTHDLMIRIGRWTIVEKMTNQKLEIPTYSFTLIDEKEMESRIQNNIYLTDMLGHVRTVSRLAYVFKNGRNVPIKEMKIRTRNATDIGVTIWASNAEKFDEAQATTLSEKEPLVVVLTAMTVKAFKGQITLSSTSATRIYMNLKIDEVNNFRKTVPYPLRVTTIVETLENKAATTKPLLPSKKTTKELLQLDRVADLGKKFICEATIKQIDSSKGWWYNACPNCTIGVSNYNGVLCCRQCGQLQNLPIQWYKLHTTIVDDSGEAIFDIFGKQAGKLIKLSPSELINLPSSDRYTLPPIIEQIVGQKCTFTVSINDRELTKPEITFNVSELITEAPTAQKNMRIEDINDERNPSTKRTRFLA